MRHIVSILLQNEAGALSRVAGLFASRGYNIENLSVAPTQDPSVSRLTLVTTGTDAVIAQICKQVAKLIDVIEINDLTAGAHIERELALVKINESARAQIAVLLDKYAARIAVDTPPTLVLEISATSEEVSAFIAAIQIITPILDVVRSGVASIDLGLSV